MSDKALFIGIFYGSTTCYTEMAAEKIQAQLNALFDDDLVEMHNIKDVNLSKTHEFDVVLFGISTWDFGELQEDCHQDPDIWLLVQVRTVRIASPHGS